jgi:type II restriction enzyme
MELGFEPCDERYKSATQRARVCTENWVQNWVYCPNCGNGRVEKYPNNQPVADFFCSACSEQYELKSTRKKFSAKIPDGAYESMCRRLAASDNPNFMLLSYDASAQSVTDLCVIPKHFFARSMIEARKPLSRTARRAGWVGCNIRLDVLPSAGRIFLVENRKELSKRDVLSKWAETAFLRRRSPDARGWLIEVMRCIDALGRDEFTLREAYGFAPELSHLYPENKHVKEKIRQQLQMLRDQNYLRFIGGGRYRRTRAG